MVAPRGDARTALVGAPVRDGTATRSLRALLCPEHNAAPLSARHVGGQHDPDGPRPNGPLAEYRGLGASSGQRRPSGALQK